MFQQWAGMGSETPVDSKMRYDNQIYLRRNLGNFPEQARCIAEIIDDWQAGSMLAMAASPASSAVHVISTFK